MKQSHPGFDRSFALAILLLAFALRMKGIAGSDLGLDGGLSVALARMPFRDSIALLAHDVHPPLYYSLLRPWLWIVGTSPFAIKFLGALLSTIGVAAAIGWIRSLVGGRGALLAGLVLACAPAAIEVGASVREFGPAVTLMVLAAWAYTRWSRRSPMLFVILTALAFWTSFAAVAVPAGAVIDAIARRSWRRLIVSLVAGATILPWLAYIFSQGFLRTLESNGPRQTTYASAPLLGQMLDLAKVLTGGAFLQPSLLGPSVVGLALLALVAGLVGVQKTSAEGQPHRSDYLVFVGVALAASLLLAFAVNTTWTREGMSPRYALPSLPFFLVLLAGMVERVTFRFPALVAFAGLIPIIGVLGDVRWYDRPAIPIDYWNPVATVAFLDTHVGPTDQIVFVSAEQAGYYEVLSEKHRPWTLIPVGTDYLAGNIAERSATLLPRVAAQSKIVWLLLYHQLLGKGTLQVGDWLSLHEFALKPMETSDSEIDPYLTTGAVAIRPELSGVTFVDGVGLSVGAWPTTIRPGETLPIELDWTARNALDKDYTVFVHLVDGDGKIWAQHDAWPVNGRAPTTTWQFGTVLEDRHALIVPPDLRPGQYWLEVGLYDNRGRLALLSGGDTVRVGPLVGPT